MATGLYERYYSYRLNGPCRMYRLQWKIRCNGHCRAKPTPRSATPQILTQTRQFTRLSRAAQWFTQESMCRSGSGRSKQLRASELRASGFDVTRFLGNGRRTRIDSGIPAWILVPYILLPAIRLPPQKPPPGDALPARIRLSALTGRRLRPPRISFGCPQFSTETDDFVKYRVVGERPKNLPIPRRLRLRLQPRLQVTDIYLQLFGTSFQTDNGRSHLGNLPERQPKVTDSSGPAFNHANYSTYTAGQSFSESPLRHGVISLARGQRQPTVRAGRMGQANFGQGNGQGNVSTVREITDALFAPSPCLLPRGARGH